MSAYQINKLCHRAYHDIAFREALMADRPRPSRIGR